MFFFPSICHVVVVWFGDWYLQIRRVPRTRCYFIFFFVLCCVFFGVVVVSGLRCSWLSLCFSMCWYIDPWYVLNWCI